MAKMIHDADVDLNPILSRRIAVIGYGAQGHAHALNLKDSGADVRVGVRPGSRGWKAAEKDGVAPPDPAAAAEWADVVMILVPDLVQPDLFTQQIAPHLAPGKMLMFAHGFAIRFGWIAPPPGVDVSMVAPKAPGHRVREVFKEGAGVPGLVAIHNDATGNARTATLAYAKGIGCTRAGVIETTFSEETETDLFGEQAVLCGGTAALVKAGFEQLIEAGGEAERQPEVAYFECMHELKLIVDLMYRGGLNYMRYSISDTAEWGDYQSGPRIVTAETKKVMKQILTEIQSGEFAKKWIAENEAGMPNYKALRDKDMTHPIAGVRARLRALIPVPHPV